MNSLDFIENRFDLRLIVEIGLEDNVAVGAGVACTLDVPAFHLEGLDDLTTKEAGGAGDESCFLCHCC